MQKGGVKIEMPLARLNARGSVKQRLMKSVSLLECNREQFRSEAAQSFAYTFYLRFTWF